MPVGFDLIGFFKMSKGSIIAVPTTLRERCTGLFLINYFKDQKLTLSSIENSEE